jgi:tape measure domain-containing protein
MAFDVSFIYKLHDQISPELVKMGRNMKGFSDKAVQSLDKVGQRMTSLGKTMAVKVTAPIGLLGGMALRSSAQMETLETAFVGILGSGEKASQMVSELFEFTAKTPFQLEGVASSAKQLLAAGVASEAITEQLQMLGDISAAANVPLQDMSAIFAKIKNKGKAMTEEILQMSDRGIPIIQILSDEFGIAKNKVFDLASKGKISFEVIQKAMQNMTKEGGFANKAMILQSKTLSGVFSTLKDNIALSLGAIGDTFKDDIKKMAVGITEFMQKIKDFTQENQALVKVLVIIGASIAVVAPLLIIIGQMSIGIAALAKGFTILAGGIKLVTLALAASPFSLLLVTLTGIAAGIALFRDEIDALISKVKEFVANLSPVKAAVNLFGKIKEKVGSVFKKEEIGFKDINLKKQLTEDITSKSKFSGNLDINVKAPEGTNTIMKIPENTANFNTGVNSIFAGS